MKRMASYYLVGLLILLCTSCVGSDNSSSFSIETQQRIESAVTANLAKYGGKDPIPGVVVGVWVPGRGTFVKGIGYADLAARRPMNIADRFRIASNTKTFVVTVLLQLVDEGKLSLDDKLVKFNLGVDVPNAERITIRQLCNMTTGIPEYLGFAVRDIVPITPHTKFTPHQLIALAVQNPPDFAPGEKWGYSNTNYLLLGLIIEAVTGNRLENEIRDRLLIPLGLINTSFPVNDPEMHIPYSHGYELDDDGNWEDETVLFHPSFTWAAGVMVSDMEDMKKWVKEYVTGSTNSAATQAERLTCVETGSTKTRFGLGIVCTSSGWYGYTGGIPGYNTAAYYRPSEDATIVILVNSEGDEGVANAIVRDIGEILFPEND